MSLSNALEANRAILKGPRCTVCTLMASLSSDDLAALEAAMADTAYTSAAISRALKAEGHQIAPITVGRHRKKDCRG